MIKMKGEQEETAAGSLSQKAFTRGILTPRAIGGKKGDQEGIDAGSGLTEAKWILSPREVCSEIPMSAVTAVHYITELDAKGPFRIFRTSFRLS
jgi:hypothetical protein